MVKGHWALTAWIGGMRDYEEYRLIWDTEHAFDRLARGETGYWTDLCTFEAHDGDLARPAVLESAEQGDK